jgi:hypothetical protein
MHGLDLPNWIVPNRTLAGGDLHRLRSPHVSAVNRYLKGRKMFEDDRSYYEHRAEVELARAQESTLHSVVRIHYQLAEAYLDKIASTEPVQSDPA